MVMFIINVFVLLKQIYDGSNQSAEVGFRKENRKLNRFKNITVCKYIYFAE